MTSRGLRFFTHHALGCMLVLASHGSHAVVDLPQADGADDEWSALSLLDVVGAVHHAPRVDAVLHTEEVRHLLGPHGAGSAGSRAPPAAPPHRAAGKDKAAASRGGVAHVGEDHAAATEEVGLGGAAVSGEGEHADGLVELCLAKDEAEAGLGVAQVVHREAHARKPTPLLAARSQPTQLRPEREREREREREQGGPEAGACLSRL